MSTMLIPASPSASASCATIPGRLGTATRSSLTGPPARSASSSRRRSARAPSIQRSSRAGSPARRSSRTRCERGEVRVQLALERLAVGQEDVAPQRRVRARHARGVAEARAGRRQALRLVGQLARRLADQHVREHVRQVADGRHQAVVHLGGDRRRARAERGHEAEEALVEHAAGALGRRQVPGRVLEQVGARVLDARRLRAGERMAADEPLRRRATPSTHEPLDRADVADDAVAAVRERLCRERRQRAHRRADEAHLGAVDRLRHRPGRAVDRAPLERARERARVRVVAGRPPPRPPAHAPPARSSPRSGRRREARSGSGAGGGHRVRPSERRQLVPHDRRHALDLLDVVRRSRPPAPPEDRRRSPRRGRGAPRR